MKLPIRIGYILVPLGLLLAVACSLQPQETGSYRLHTLFMFWQMLPYLILASLCSQRKHPYSLPTGAVLMVLLHAYALSNWSFGNWTTPVSLHYLPIWSVVLALPLGALLGRGWEKLTHFEPPLAGHGR